MVSTWMGDHSSVEVDAVVKNTVNLFFSGDSPSYLGVISKLAGHDTAGDLFVQGVDEDNEEAKAKVLPIVQPSTLRMSH